MSCSWRGTSCRNLIERVVLLVSAYTEIISIRVDDTLLFKIKENLRPGENVSDFIRKAMRSYLAIVQSE